MRVFGQVPLAVEDWYATRLALWGFLTQICGECEIWPSLAASNSGCPSNQHKLLSFGLLILQSSPNWYQFTFQLELVSIVEFSVFHHCVGYQPILFHRLEL